MNKKVSTALNMFQVVLNILTGFNAVWSGFTAFANGVVSFTGKKNEVESTALKQQNSLKMYTENKRKVKMVMANTALVTRGKVCAFASNTGNTILLGLMKISFSKLFHLKDSASIGYADTIYNAAVAMTPAEQTAYDITPAELTNLRKTIDDFSNLPSPIQMRAVRKQLTDLLPVLCKETTASLTEVLDGLMHDYKETHPDFYAQYFNARQLLDSHRHTTLQGSAIDQLTGHDLQNVKVIIASSTGSFEEMTDVQGNFKQQISPEINYSATFILSGYEPQVYENINLNRGEHEKLLVKLRKS